MEIFKGKTKSERGGKTYWNDTGHTLFVDYKGQEMQIGMVDSRAPEVKVYFFKPQARTATAEAPATGINQGFADPNDGSPLPF